MGTLYLPPAAIPDFDANAISRRLENHANYLIFRLRSGDYTRLLEPGREDQDK